MTAGERDAALEMSREALEAGSSMASQVQAEKTRVEIVISKLAERLFLEICRQPESRVRGSNNKGDVAKLIFNSTPRSSLACAPLSPSFLKHAHCSCTDFDSLLLRSSMTLFTRWRTAVSSTSVVSHRCCG